LSNTVSPDDITGLILSGGRGSRMGGVDKGLQNFRGAPLALHALMRLGPQVSTVLVNANRNLAAYESFGVNVVPDALPDFAGPLAGFLAGLEACQTPYLAVCPVDSPLFPLDYVERLAQTIGDADVAVVEAAETAGDGSTLWRAQPVFCMLRADLLESLVRFTHGGGSKIDAWTAQHRTVHVRFDRPSDLQAFANANTLAELHALAAAA
jgi:molybdenum cofactor guanylyltransferase